MKAHIRVKETGEEFDSLALNISKASWLVEKNPAGGERYFLSTFQYDSATGKEICVGTYNADYYDILLSKD